MSDNTLQLSNPQPRAITYLATQIGGGTIVGSQIATNTITGGTSGNIDQGTIDAANIAARTITADLIEVNTITGDNIDSLDITSKIIVADTGTIGGWTLGATELAGPVGAVIRSGQTDFNLGTGFWLGNVAGTPKFSIGTASGNQMSWDGTNLRITGSLTPTTVFNTITYTTANLPVPPTTAGFNPPSANE